MNLSLTFLDSILPTLPYHPLLSSVNPALPHFPYFFLIVSCPVLLLHSSVPLSLCSCLKVSSIDPRVDSPPPKKNNNNSKLSDDSHSSHAILKKSCYLLHVKYTSVTQSILCLIFLMNVRTIQNLNYSGQESKFFFFFFCFLQFMFRTLLWPWNKVNKVIKLGMNWQTWSKVITMPSLKNLA